MGSSPLQSQKRAPTRQQAEDELANLEKNYLASLDANDLLKELLRLTDTP